MPPPSRRQARECSLAFPGFAGAADECEGLPALRGRQSYRV